MSMYALEMDAVALGLTKPPTKLGVPFSPFFLNIFCCLIGWMVYQSLTGQTGAGVIAAFVGLWTVVHLFMVIVSLKDIFGLPIFMINAIYFRQHATHAKWGNTDSYSS